MKYLTRRYSNNNHDLWADFENFFNASPFYNSANSGYTGEGAAHRPALDLYEDESNYFVRAEIPGFKKEDLQVVLESGQLDLRGERKEKGQDGKSSVSFHRSVNLPDTVKSEEIAANYENGLLTITIPKAEAAKPLRIEINN